MIVLPRGGIESSPRTTTAMIALRGSPSSRTAAPAIAWSWATTKSTSSSLLSGPTSSGASCVGGAGESRPSRPATHSRRRALHDRRDDDDEEDGVEDRLRVRHVGREHERGEHDRHRPAESGPAEQQPLACSEVAERRRRPDGRGPDHEHEQQREREPGSGDVRQLRCGNTSRPSTMNSATCARNASPSWKATSWRR